MPPKEDVLRVRIDGALKKDAEAMATSQGETLSVVMRQILRKAVQEWKAENDPNYQAFLRHQAEDAANRPYRYPQSPGSPSPHLNDREDEPASSPPPSAGESEPPIP